MARSLRSTRYTVYDVMDARGVFDENPANSTARDNDGNSVSVWPVKYPKMLYHPKGEERVIRQAEEIETKRGVKLVGEERELIHKIARNEAEEKALLDEGWHMHPAKAIEARTGVAPPMSPQTVIDSQAERIAAMEKELSELRELRQTQAKEAPAKAKLSLSAT